MPLPLIDAVAGLVERDRRSIRWYVVWAVVVVFVGFAVFFGSAIVESVSAAHLDAIIKLGGSFIASLAVFPLKEVRERRQRIETLQWLVEQYEQHTDEHAWFDNVIRERLRKEAGA